MLNKPLMSGMEREKEIANKVFKWYSGEKVPPYECRLNPTNKCNLACLPCISRGKPSYNREEELTKDEYIRIVGEAAILGAQRFDICGGGEPFCAPYTISIMEEIKKHGLSERQAKALRYLIEEEYISRAKYVELYKVSLRTANYDLSILEKLKLIKREGIGRAIKYRLT